MTSGNGLIRGYNWFKFKYGRSLRQYELLQGPRKTFREFFFISLVYTKVCIRMQTITKAY